MTIGAVRITTRETLPGTPFTQVFAYVDGAESGWYNVLTAVVGTDDELKEILAESANRMAIRDATRAGID